MKSFYDTLKSLVNKVFLPHRARKGSYRVGDPCRMPCMVRKEVWLEPCRVRATAGDRIREKKKKTPPLFSKQNENKGEGYLCKIRDCPV